MTTKDILNQMEKELYEFIASSPPNYPSVWKSLIRSRLRTLLESFGEEIIGEDENIRFLSKISTERSRAKNQLRDEQRLKVKEILSNLK